MGPDAIFPLNNWTDENIWDYIEEHNVPQQQDRYDVKNRTEWEDKRNNSDYAHVCIACCDKSNPVKSVMCPKLETQVCSMLDFVPYHDPKGVYFG